MITSKLSNLRKKLRVTRMPNTLHSISTGSAALHVAVEENHPQMIGVLLDCGANPNLEYGILHSCTALHYAVLKARVECVRALLEPPGAAPNAGTGAGRANTRRVPIDVNQQDYPNKYTPLQTAITSLGQCVYTTATRFTDGSIQPSRGVNTLHLCFYTYSIFCKCIITIIYEFTSCHVCGCSELYLQYNVIKVT